MHREHKRLSTGSILTLVLTAAVLVGSVLIFSSFRAGSTSRGMRATEIASLVLDSLHGVTQAPTPESTTKLVTVTLPPTTVPQPVYTVDPHSLSNERHSFRITASGMLLFESDVSESVYNKSTKTFDYSKTLSSLAPYMANNELAISFLTQNVNFSDNKYTDLIAPSAIMEAVVGMGARVLSIASEHVLDEGGEATEALTTAFKSRGVQCVGVNNASASQQVFLDCNGAKVALLSYVQELSPKGKIALASGNEYMTLYSEATAQREIASARAQGAECVIVCMNWGREDQTSVTSAQREIARNLAAYGADIVLGTRCKRVLPMEWVESVRGDGRKQKTLVVYSMGSTLCESRDGYDISGILLHVNITCSEAEGVVFDSVTYTPTYIWRQSNQYRAVASNAGTPQGMSSSQIEVMGRARTRIAGILDNQVAKEEAALSLPQ